MVVTENTKVSGTSFKTGFLLNLETEQEAQSRATTLCIIESTS